jgi:hypothetical protein
MELAPERGSVVWESSRGVITAMLYTYLTIIQTTLRHYSL